MRTLALLAFLAAAAAEPPAGVVSGRVALGPDAISGSPGRAWDLANTVVYLVPEGDIPLPRPPADRGLIRQQGAAFSPSFLVVVKGQTVDFPNDDPIDHNVFSLSRVKAFDLGVYPRGKVKSVTFEREGPVLIFCSVHESMNGVIFVAPNPLYAITDKGGRFSISSVPPGRYRVRTWNTALPEGMEFVEVTSVDVELRRPTRVRIDLAKALREAASP